MIIMTVENVRTRTLVDITGVLLVRKDPRTELPYLKKGITSSFFDQANQAVIDSMGGPYETFANSLFGGGNLIKRLFFDQGLNWEVLRREQLDKLLTDEPSRFEVIANRFGGMIRDPKWVPPLFVREGTPIDLDDFMLDQGRVAELARSTLDEPSNKNTIVSGHTYLSRGALVKKLEQEVVKIVDPGLGMILPPHYEVASGKLKLATALWSRDGTNKEIVKAHEDDTAIALLLSVICDEVFLPVSRLEAMNQPHLERVILESGMRNQIRESRLRFAEAA